MFRTWMDAFCFFGWIVVAVAVLYATGVYDCCPIEFHPTR